MKEINILITAIGGDIGSNIINILNAQEGVKFNVYGTDINEKNYSTDVVHKFYKVDRVSSKNYGKQIINIIRENSIEFIIPVAEMEIIWFNDNLNLFSELNTHILINKANIVKTFLNKLETSKILLSMKIKTPQTIELNKFNEEIDYPIIIKSKFSIYGKDLYIVKNRQQLENIKNTLKNYEHYIVQEYIGTIEDEYTTTVYKDKSSLEVITFKRKLTGEMTSFAEIRDEKILKNYAKIIATKLDLYGSINIQSRKVGNDFYIFEINPRFSSTIYIRNNFNFHDLIWWINSFNKEKLCKIDYSNKVEKSGYAILGYKYKFFKGDDNENR